MQSTGQTSTHAVSLVPMHGYTFSLSMTRRIAGFTALLFVCGVRMASSQALPSEPIALADGRVVVSGDLTAGYGSADPGFFNYTDYEHSSLRLFRIDVSAAVKAGAHFTLPWGNRTENVDSGRPDPLYSP